jgi:hypothetical protein
VDKRKGTPVKGSANLKRGTSREVALDDLESLKKTLRPRGAKHALEDLEGQPGNGSKVREDRRED